MAKSVVKSHLSEGLVIVASILIAFALHAWWSGFQQAQADRQMLRELAQELALAQQRIETSIEELEGVISASGELVERLGPEQAPLEPAAAEQLLLRITRLNTLEVPSGALGAAVATGQTGRISNGSLRAALAEWPALVADVRENHEWHRADADEVLVPAVAAYISVRNAFDLDDMLDTGRSSFALDPAPLQRDPVFEARLVWRMARQLATLRESRLLRDANVRLRELIEAELE